MAESNTPSIPKRVLMSFAGCLALFVLSVIVIVFVYSPADAREEADLSKVRVAGNNRVFIYCDPPGAMVTQPERQGNDARDPKGMAGSAEPIPIDALDTNGDTASFTLYKEWYRPKTFTVPVQELKKGMWPPLQDPIIVLEPESFVKGAVLRHPIALGISVLSLLGLAYFGFGLFGEYRTLKELEALKAEADDDPYIGRLISDYRVGRLLGKGGYGAVYVAHTKGNLRVSDFAIKIAQYDGINAAMDQELKDRFEREMYLVKDLAHRNVGRIIDFDSTKSFSWVLMPLYDGGELEEWIEKGKLTPANVLRFAKGIAEGLSLAHERGICHRDLKPANVMIDKGEAVIIDFGLARAVDSKTLTMEGAMMGTPVYMPQEQLMDSKSVTDKADQYAYGVILYEMITGGKVPFKTSKDNGEVMALVQEKLMKGAIPLRETDPSQSEELETVLAKMMASDAVDRYENILEAFKAFEGAYKA